MIAHQAINVDDRSIPLSCGFKIGKKLFPVTNAFENRFLFIPSRANMIESAGELYPQCSGHNQIKDFIGVETLSIAYWSKWGQTLNCEFGLTKSI